MLINSPIEPLVELSESARWSTLARMVFNCSIVPWLDLMTSERLGVSLVLSSAPFCTGGPVARLAVDVHDGIAQNADSFQAGRGIGAHSVSIFGSDLEGHLDRGELARGYDSNFGHGADRIAFEVDRSTLFEAGGILKIGAKDDLALEQATRASRHEEDESSQGCQRHDDQNAHLQL